MSIQLRYCKRFSARDEGFTLDVDLSVPSKGVTAFFGHSGSGKTTLLRCIAGLEEPDLAQLNVNGQNWQAQPAHRRDIGYVFQEASLFPHLSAQRNLDYAIKRSSKAADPALFTRVIDILGIGGLLARFPDKLSGGERQRVAIARALLRSPQLLLMDEPLASLDPARKQEILPYLENIHTQFDTPIFYVSHAIDEVARLADHVVVLHQGSVSAQGEVKRVFARTDLPLHIGDETGVILLGTVVERDTRWRLKRVVFDGGELWLRDGGDAIGRSVRVRVLARDISLALSVDDNTSILNRLATTVTDIIDDEDEAMALIRLTVGSSSLLARVTRRSVAQLGLQPGMPVWAQIKSAAMIR
ncbi:molybdenum ABC transporter ATP-binding protein [Litorivivens sp.]|uniref:molybdenum ABC transporter ATP-binding protein n=1 Tax=Litorivivens sp. TaxID=2020868 RepID=UPI0035650CFA